MKRFACLALAGCSSLSMAITFDWENLSTGNFGAVSQTVGGLMLTATGDPGMTVVNASFFIPPFGNRSIIGNGPGTSSSAVVLAFSAGVHSVRIGFGDGGGDDDGMVTVIARQFITGAALQVQSFQLGTSSSVHSFTFNAPNIGFLECFSAGGDIGQENSVYWDNITTDPQSVPEPFTTALMGGAAVAGFRRLRRRKA